MVSRPKAESPAVGPLPRRHGILYADAPQSRPHELDGAAHDTLVAAKILADDNNTIIASVDGSRVMYDKSNPRTEIFIEEMEDVTT